ncbi:hypothetical protein GCM10029963_50370 [Micromonospora andamanensis]|nr:hypothetical protein Vwe01_27860 [Micromonospora andamanensis]
MRSEPFDVTDPALETVRPGQITPGSVGRHGPGADEGLADPTGTGRRQRHELWMRRALEVAVTGPAVGDVASPAGGAGSVASAGGDTVAEPGQSGDVPVGAVLYGPDGSELATGRNERELTGDPTAHAEVLALRRAAQRLGRWRLDGCTLVVTLEPCTMCAGALVLARVSTVVFGAWESKTGAAGSLWDVLRDRRLNHRPEVYGGILEAENAAVLRAFFR